MTIKNKHPRILVLSHNCFSETSANGRTLSTFFRFWDTNSVAQFFVNPETPNSKVCNSFYRVTDSDLFKAKFKSINLGGVINNTIVNRKPTEANIKTNGRVKKLKSFFPSLLYIFRNVLWSQKQWNNTNFNLWIDAFDPEIILLQPGDYSFLYKMARIISHQRHIPLVVYNSEDYFLKDRKSISPLFHLQRYFFKKEVKKTYSNASHIIYSNDLLQINLHKYFTCECSVILSSSEIQAAEFKESNQHLKLIYAGNLSHERWKSLVTIGELAKKINENLVIDVFSATLPQEAESEFKIEKGIKFHGSVSYEIVVEQINLADIVIHAEGFTDFTKWDIKHGFSTKIADLLSSGKCFLMYGPEEIACVKYLVQNEAAWVASSVESLKEVLLKILTSQIERKKYVSNAKKLVKNRHNIQINCQLFEDVILNTLAQKKQ